MDISTGFPIVFRNYKKHVSKIFLRIKNDDSRMKQDLADHFVYNVSICIFLYTPKIRQSEKG